MRLALVHDDLIQYGGAERLFLAMVEAFPKADVFTSMVSDRWKSQSSRPPRYAKRCGQANLKTQSHSAKLKTSFMQRLPFKEKLYRHYFILYPLAFESFDFTDYDVVLSSSSRFAHGVVTRPETPHICYMNSPGHMLWEPHAYFDSSPLHFLTSPFVSYLRLWDYAAAQRVDYFIANSKTPQRRIKKYYGRDSRIIYPFVDLDRFQPPKFDRARLARRPLFEDPYPKNCSGEVAPVLAMDSSQGDYFLIVSRLAAWKKIDIAIKAFNQLHLPLKIIGEGPDLKRLKKMAGPTVEFLGRLTDKEVVSYYKNCQALIFPQEEDFGIVPLEAMACGKPVVALRAGGALETVIEGRTGEFFYPQMAEALAEVLSHLDTLKYQSKDCRKQAEKFGKERFKRELEGFVEGKFAEHRRKLSF